MTISIGASVLDPSLYISDVRTKRKASIFQELVALASGAGIIRDPAVLRETLLTRERITPSSIGKGVAVPHARSVVVIEARLLVARSLRGIDWGATDGQPVQIVLLALSPPEWSDEAHLDLVARAAGAARLQKNRSRLLSAEGFADVLQVFAGA